jgi:uroporphyrinogen decarboxylase
VTKLNFDFNTLQKMTPKQRFINACLGQEVDRPPVWMMRQAGRYLPEYRAIRDKTPTKAMMQTPEIACEITLQPVRLIGVDAAILYSDILMIPDALGMGLNFIKGEGPSFAFAIDNPEALNRLNTQNLNSRLTHVFEAARLCVKALPADYPLLGFAGAPFTVACYMINGKGGSDFNGVKALMWNDSKTFDALMTILTDATIAYLLEQANAGVVAVQLFDTWAGLLSPKDYQERVMPYTARIFDALTQNKIASIHYIKGGDYLLPHLAKLSSNVVGVDWRVDLKTIRARIGAKQAVQGNFDPDLLLASPEVIRRRTAQMLADIPNPKCGYIANLGHGIGEKTPVANAKLFIETVKNFTV